ncbi:MAG: phosphate ABC transporter permease PstA [Acidimicrobiales bacterium]|nr:phosphate ABC transporter permease PstA [Acidimicrobiales bacterium]
MAGSAAAAAALVWLIFSVAGISGALGFGICFLGAFLTIYGIICWQLYGMLAMKDRLATLAIWSGALVAFVPLVGVIAYVIIKGAAVVFADFPHFFLADMSGLTATSPVTAVGAGAAIVGTIEQVALATLITVPLGVLTATYLVNNRNAFSRLVSNVVDAMTGSPAIIAGLFIYLLWVVPQKEAGQTGFAAALSLSVMMLPIVTRASQEVIAIVPGSLREAALALGSPQWRSVLRVMLPTARVGLVTAMILGIARVAGETAPVLFTAGGNSKYNWNPFVGRQDDLPLRVYELIFQPGVNTTRVAWGVAFVLVLVVLTLFILARLIGAKKPGPSGFTVPWRTRRSPEEVEAE